jgi:hypothetical protein
MHLVRQYRPFPFNAHQRNYARPGVHRPNEGLWTYRGSLLRRVIRKAMSAVGVALVPALPVQYWTVPLVLLAAYQDGTTPPVPQAPVSAPSVLLSNEMTQDSFRGNVLLPLADGRCSA